MKKLVSIALALMLLLASAALAEGVYVERISNVSIAFEQNGQLALHPFVTLTKRLRLGGMGAPMESPFPHPTRLIKMLRPNN